MGTYRFIDDRTFECKAASLADLFETAAQAAISLEYNPSTVGFEKEIGLSAAASNLTGLLSEWVDQCLRLRQDSGFVPGDFIVYEVGETPDARYGERRLEVKGAIRGRLEGDWLNRTGPRATSVVDGSVSIIQKRWSTKASMQIAI